MNPVFRQTLLAVAGSTALPLAGCLESGESSDEERGGGSTPEQQADTGRSESASVEHLGEQREQARE